MEQTIQFHCSIASNFQPTERSVRAFPYYNYQIEPHVHDFYEINIILAGTGRHNIENASIDTCAGDVFVIPPMTVHSYTDTHVLTVYHILIKPAFINSLPEVTSEEGWKILLKTEPMMRKNNAKELFLKLNTKQLLLIKPDLDALSEEENGGAYPTDLHFQNYTVLKLLSWFADLIQKQQGRSNTEHVNEKSILQVLNHIYQNYTEEISVESLCRIASMSKATLFRNFKVYCGCTPMEFVRKQRKEAARRMLKEGSYSKTQIAQECGFYDLSHMERLLKKKDR